LKIVDSRVVTVKCKDQKHHPNEKDVDDKHRNNLDDRQDADPKNHFFDKETVFDDRIASPGKSVGKEEPGDDTGHEPENKGEVLHRLRLEADLEDEPENKDSDQGMNEGPQEPEIGAKVAGAKIRLGQIENDFSGSPDIG
jgi:hypothetical protein